MDQAVVAPAKTSLIYQGGFGNEFSTEALTGALPIGRNNPQKPPFGLFSELVSATAFSAPRAQNRRSYLFRIKPSVLSSELLPWDAGDFITPPLGTTPYPGALRWSPFPIGEGHGDFIEGMSTLCGNGSPVKQSGMAIHIYRATKSMERRAFSNADGEFLIIPDHGAITVVTELGIIEAAPSEVVLIPRGMKFRVELAGSSARGWVCENFGYAFQIPELGIIGSHGLANPVDFLTPVAAYEESDGEFELINKYAGRFWSTFLDGSPFNVVAWRGNWAPCKYDMTRFSVIGALAFDHPDPSIFCALTSPSSEVAGGNADFMILPPRWVVAEDTFRPPGFHRNSVAEFLGLVQGTHESRASAFPPGAMSLHNNWTPHGPDFQTYEGGRNAELNPVKVEGSLIFMIESRYPLEISPWAMAAENRIRDSAKGWGGFQKRFPNSQ